MLAALGLADASYLAVLHWQGEVPPCLGYAGCGQVNTSPYGVVRKALLNENPDEIQGERSLTGADPR
jgi:hypothetical protein